MQDHDEYRDTDIAIIGMAAHLPGASSVTEFWDNLREGRSAIRRLSPEELRAAGESATVMAKSNYVPYAAPLDGFADFDAEFFGFSPKEAAILDPQHRQFLEIAWEAFEDAGHPPAGFPGPVGVFAGCGMGSYFYFNLCSNPDLVDDVGMFLLRHTGNDKDFLSTRVSHVLDLRGPSVNVQTACSTSLVAVHYALQALLTGECDMALAGGVTVELPQGRGYLHKENEILSPDGQCHAFDHRAQGTVFGSGAGAVVLRRLSDALADGDRIIAVIRGSAINNDGAQKAGYLAPSVEGQARAVAEAHQVAGVSAESIGYVECHGTGTYLGDPIEIAALTEAFDSGQHGFCRIGSVKTNIGHLDTAAGVASLIKAALALQHRALPPSLGYEAPNPAIDFDATPFIVNDRLTEWRADMPLRAGVNSLGVGGTNAHIVLQEAPAPAPVAESDWPFHVLTLSARSRQALDAAARDLAAHLRAHPEQSLADIAFTLKEGRTGFGWRRAVVAETHDAAADLLERNDTSRVFTHSALDNPEVVFMFPGGGAQYAGMARELYATEPVFAEWMDRGLAWLQPKVDDDLRALWLPETNALDAANNRLRRPSLQLPLIMITEYALAQMFIGWGVQPAALVGHSMGENTAACLAGVLSFEDCIDLVLLRGRLFDSVPRGGMLSVPLSVAALRPYLAEHLAGDLDIAAINAPDLTVVSGPQDALQALAQRLDADAITATPIAIDIAAHSRMLDPVLDEFRAFLRDIALHAPEIPVISNRTGQPLTAAQATDPDYWVGHLRNTVLFADCVETLSHTKNRIYLEMGPGKALAALARLQGGVPGQQVLSALRHADEDIADDLYHIGLLGRIWALGGCFGWGQIWGDAARQRVALPTYPFQRTRYFIEPGTAAATTAPALERCDDIGDWGRRLHWKPAFADCEIDVTRDLATLSESWLIFSDTKGVAAPVIAALRKAGQHVTEVRAGDIFTRKAPDLYTLAPEQGPEGYAMLLQDMALQGVTPTRIGHFWLATDDESFRPGSSLLHRHLEQGFQSLLGLMQALQSENVAMPVHLTVFTLGAQAVNDEGLPFPEKALVAGPLRVGPKEIPGLTCACLDIQPVSAAPSALMQPLLEELCATPGNTTAALRGYRRYAQVIRPAPLPQDLPAMPEGAHWVVTGGLGGIGLTLAETLIREYGARITLITRSSLPPRADWADWLARTPPPDKTSRRIRALQHLEASGGQVHVATADVANIDEMRTALDSARAAFGQPYGLIHAAGDIADAPILGKSDIDVERVLAPKLHGLQVINALLPDGALDMLVLFSSSSTVTAPAGQVDYVAANEYLNAYAQSRAGGRTRVLALNWGAWADTGMAADLLADPPQPSAAQAQPCTEPLFDTIMSDGTTHTTGTHRLDFHLHSNHWLMAEHRTKAGTALLPGTGVLDMAAQALHALKGTASPFVLEDTLFIRPVVVADGAARDLRMVLHMGGSGFCFALQSDIAQDGPGRMLNAQGRIRPIDPPEPRHIDLETISARCPQRTPAPDIRLPQGREMAFGPRWQVLHEMALGRDEGIAELALPVAYQDDMRAGHLLHPALMDMATGWALHMIAQDGVPGIWAPISYDRVQVLQPLPARLVSHARLRKDGTAGTASFDITLALPDGQVVAEIEGLNFRRLGPEALAETQPLRDAEIIRDTPPARQMLSPAQEHLRDMLALGIKRAEGGHAFLRALSSPDPVLHMNPVDLQALRDQAQAQASAQRAASNTLFDRPQMDSAYLGPRNDTEAALAAMWQDLLGITQIGVEDNFFDLGGHSLIAVRLFSQIRKRWGVDFPLSVLFEAPTIATLADRIAAAGGTQGAAEATASASNAAPAIAYRHLVPMQTSAPARAAPFFIVAGMFGNVLNLRHLARLVGTDRPVYGLQARGLLGDDMPHTRIEDAATDYIAEIRKVQPEGPYHLAGFSGGGITAYEIAQQLEAAGETVQIVVLLDTPLPQMPSLSRKDKLLIKLADFRQQGPGHVLEWWRARRAWQQHLAQGPATDSADTFHNTAIEAAFRQAVGQYRLRPWAGNLVLLRPPLDRRWKVSGGRWINGQRDFVYPDNDWTRFAPNLRVTEVPGDHDSMVLEPNVRVLAARLRDLLEEPQAPDCARQAAE